MAGPTPLPRACQGLGHAQRAPLPPHMHQRRPQWCGTCSASVAARGSPGNGSWRVQHGPECRAVAGPGALWAAMGACRPSAAHHKVRALARNASCYCDGACGGAPSSYRCWTVATAALRTHGPRAVAAAQIVARSQFIVSRTLL